jgi:hypothetical protein
MKEYKFTVQLEIYGEGNNKAECIENAIEELDMYSVENLFYKEGYKIVKAERVD